ncbi:MAG: hypothetical protein AB1649_18615 [Chloroflexota bacterium]
MNKFSKNICLVSLGCPKNLVDSVLKNIRFFDSIISDTIGRRLKSVYQFRFLLLFSFIIFFSLDKFQEHFPLLKKNFFRSGLLEHWIESTIKVDSILQVMAQPWAIVIRPKYWNALHRSQLSRRTQLGIQYPPLAGTNAVGRGMRAELAHLSSSPMV